MIKYTPDMTKPHETPIVGPNHFTRTFVVGQEEIIHTQKVHLWLKASYKL